MPKTRLDKDERLRHLIRRYMFESNIAVPALARRMNLSAATLYTRMSNTDGFKISELKKLRNIVHIPEEELRSALI